MKTLAIVVPCYNEEETIHPFLEACQSVEKQIANQLLVNQVTIWNRKLEDLKETSDGVNSSIPKIQGTTTSETN